MCFSSHNFTKIGQKMFFKIDTIKDKSGCYQPDFQTRQIKNKNQLNNILLLLLLLSYIHNSICLVLLFQIDIRFHIDIMLFHSCLLCLLFQV